MTSQSTAHVLVTGGCGFLGSCIVKALSEKHPHWAISVLDITQPSLGLETLISASGGTYRQVDITSAESVANAFPSFTPDVVVHTAGVVPARNDRYSTNHKQWEKVKAINYQGTVNILNATLQSKCRRFVYTSSCTAVIDDLDHDYFNMDEHVPLGLATLHYGKSKGMAEQFVLSSEHSSKGLKACALRPCTIIGEGDVAVISLIHDLIAKGETNFIVGDGHNLYDFMYIENAADAHVLAVENLLTTQTAAGEAFFISNQEPVFFWDFFAYIWAQFGHVPKYRIHIPVTIAWFAAWIFEIMTFFTGRPSTLDTGSVKDGIRTQYSNNAKAIKILGYRPKVGIAEAVRRSCQDYKKYLDTRKANNYTTKEDF